MVKRLEGIVNQVIEWSYSSGRIYDDPFNEVELDLVMEHSDGSCWRVPAYWAGEREWRVRFAPPKAGVYTATTLCSDEENLSLHGCRLKVEAAPYKGDHPLLKHGPLQVAESGRTLEHEDGTPFFWMGDTWWLGLCDRLSWPEDFQLLTQDRVEKGYTLIQLVAGLYPDMAPLDERGTNEAGLPWEEGFTHINPSFFDMADLRIRWLIRSGLVPCIVGAWGYYLPELGMDKMKKHWRYVIARWSAYPVIWCLAGEATMAYYLSDDSEKETAFQRQGWTEIGRYVHETDPYSRLVTLHPWRVGRDDVEDDSVLDVEMLHSGHGGYSSVSTAIEALDQERGLEPTMPIVIGELNFEEIRPDTHTPVQRLSFWSCFLSGAGGYSYGADGIWQMNTRDEPFGPSPHGGTWGNMPWEDAYRLTGSSQVPLARKLLERYPWWEFEPHQDWVYPAGGSDNVREAFAAGIPGEVRVIYVYGPVYPKGEERPRVTNLDPGLEYRAFFWDPRSGEETSIGIVRSNVEGVWNIPRTPTQRDWVIVLEAQTHS